VLAASNCTFVAIMTNFIPIFPLEIVVYPSEQLNLHIFEERYKQLISEINKEKKLFGIPPVIKNKIAETGTQVEIEKIVKQYDDGKMDITIKGAGVFRILEVIESIPAKLYSGAIVKHLSNEESSNSLHLKAVVKAIRELHKLLNITKDFKKPDEELRSYDLAHHAGLSLDEEYEVLNLLREDQRIEYLRRHLKKIIPVVAGAEALKKRIQLNGHFKELKGFDFGQSKK
jgi:Lon protease-like protein